MRTLLQILPVVFFLQFPIKLVSAVITVHCNPSKADFIDPIVSFGQRPSSHLHEFSGPPAHVISPTYTASQGIEAECTTCFFDIDRSMYWSPALYLNGQHLRMNEHVIYYDIFDKQHTVPFPVGMELVASDTRQRNQFRCLSYWPHNSSFTNNAYSTIHELQQHKDNTCNSFFRMEIRFPSCWNGIDLKSPDHISHTSYPVHGKCPPSHPVPIPSLFLEAIYYNVDFNFNQDTLQLTLENLAHFHADFISGWDPDTFRTIFLQDCLEHFYHTFNCKHTKDIVYKNIC